MVQNLMVNLSNKIGSGRHSVYSNSIIGIKPEKLDNNPIYLSKPMRSDESLDEGDDASSCGDAPISDYRQHLVRKPHDVGMQQPLARAEESEADGDISSRSSPNRLNLETDHHHIPQAVTHDRNFKQKASIQESMAHRGHQNRQRRGREPEELECREQQKQQPYTPQTQPLQTYEDGFETTLQGSPRTNDMFAQKQPRFIMNVNKASLMHIMQKPSTDSLLEFGKSGLQSPFGAAKSSINREYNEAAKSIQKTKMHQTQKHSAANLQSKQSTSFNDSRKKSCFNLSDFLCINTKKGRTNLFQDQLKHASNEQSMHHGGNLSSSPDQSAHHSLKQKALEESAEASSITHKLMTFDNSAHRSVNMAPDAAVGEYKIVAHKPLQKFHDRMPQKHSRKLSTAELLQAKALANSSSLNKIEHPQESQGPKEKQLVSQANRQFLQKEGQYSLAHSKSDQAFSLSSPTGLTLKQNDEDGPYQNLWEKQKKLITRTNQVKGATKKTQIKSTRHLSDNLSSLQPAKTASTNSHRVFACLGSTKHFSVVKPQTPQGLTFQKGERRHRDACKNLEAKKQAKQPKTLNLKKRSSKLMVGGDASSQAQIKTKASKVTTPKKDGISLQHQSKAISSLASNRARAEQQSQQLRVPEIEQLPLENVSANRVPAVRAAVPSFQMASQVLSEAIVQTDRIGPLSLGAESKLSKPSRVIQLLESPSPYLEPDDSAGRASRIPSYANSQRPSTAVLSARASHVNQKRKKQLSDLLERQPSGTLSGSLINQERKVGIPKVSAGQTGKYGKKQHARTSLIQLREEFIAKGAESSARHQFEAPKRARQQAQVSSKANSGSAAANGLLSKPLVHTGQQKSRAQALAKAKNDRVHVQQSRRVSTEVNQNDENIEDEANDGSVITLDSMRRQIQQNMNYLGSNNPFQHDKLVKPGAKVCKGAQSERTKTPKMHALSQANDFGSKKGKQIQRPTKDYFSALNKSIKTATQLKENERCYPVAKKETSLSGLHHRSPSDHQRQIPAIFTKNSVLETIGTERLNLRDSPTMESAMAQHNRQLHVSAMGNNLHSKLTPSHDLESMNYQTQNQLSKQKTIDGIFIAGAAKRSAKRMVQKTINQSVLAKRGPQKNMQIYPAGAPRDSQLKEERFDIQKVSGAMEKQMRTFQSQIFKVWHKLYRIMYLDPQCVQRVFRQKYERTISRYYGQMVVEYRQDDESSRLLETERKTTPYQIGSRYSNSVLDQWHPSAQFAKATDKLALQYQANSGSALFPAEEGLIQPGKKTSSGGGGVLAAGQQFQQPRRKVNSTYDQKRVDQTSEIFEGETTEESKATQQICEENFIYTPNSRKLNTAALVGGASSAIVQQNYNQNSARRANLRLDKQVQQRGRDSSAHALGGKPISPRQIERSLVLAKNRRQECSRVRGSLPTKMPTSGAFKLLPAEHIYQYGLMTQVTSSSSSSKSESEDKFEKTIHSMPLSKQLKKPKAEVLKVDVKHRMQFKYKLPIERVFVNLGKESQKAPVRQQNDFEPIIVEEVYTNSTVIGEGFSRDLKLMPKSKLGGLNVHKSDSSSFVSALAPEPPHLQAKASLDKILVAESTYPKDYKKSLPIHPDQPSEQKMGLKLCAERVATEESCDFFSDNVSETGAGALPESQLHVPSTGTPQSKYHLFVFVHGFQASSQDMRSFRNHLQVLLPNSMYLVSQTNEKDTDSCIEELGRKLAQEVQEFVFNYLSGFQMVNNRRVQVSMSKLSFVGHSLGGIIVREALKHLRSYQKLFHAYVSLGTPHLGYMYNSTSIVDAGIWLIKKLKQSDSLKQLSMTDHHDKRQTYLFKLSQEDHLKHFKFVVLVSSYQDSYAPHDSARIQTTSQVLQSAQSMEDSKSEIYLEMVEKILTEMRCEKMYRLDVNFKIQDRSLATLIGRTAHILMIEYIEMSSVSDQKIG